MSFEPVIWAMKDAPVADAEEWAVLALMAEHAEEDGANAMPSHGRIARFTRLSPDTVKRRVAALERRGLIRRGDQSVAERYPAYARPVVWDVMIPYTYWGERLTRIQEHRIERGRPPLTPASHPALPPAPEPHVKATSKRRKRAGDEAAEGGDNTPDQGAGSPQGATCPPVAGSTLGAGSTPTRVQAAPYPGAGCTTTHPSTQPLDPTQSGAAEPATPEGETATLFPGFDPPRPTTLDEAITEACKIAGWYIKAWKKDRGVTKIDKEQAKYWAIVGRAKTPDSTNLLTAALLAGFTSDQLVDVLRRHAHEQRGVVPAGAWWTEALVAVQGGVSRIDSRAGNGRPTTDERVRGWLQLGNQGDPTSNGRPTDRLAIGQ